MLFHIHIPVGTEKGTSEERGDGGYSPVGAGEEKEWKPRKRR